jgi:hypothetical protein
MTGQAGIGDNAFERHDRLRQKTSAEDLRRWTGILQGQSVKFVQPVGRMATLAQ